MDKLSTALSMAVPLHIDEIKKAGGPTDDDFKKATGFASVLAQKGDLLLYGSSKKGETADLFNSTARSIAVMSFIPGGIKIFGNHWETQR